MTNSTARSMTCKLGEFIYEQPAAETSSTPSSTPDPGSSLPLHIDRAAQEDSRAGRRAIEELYKRQLEEHLTELAHHYRRSSDAEKAVVYMKRAADQAAQRSSAAEAEAQYRDAFSILKELPPTPQRDRLELGVQLGLGAVLIGKGWGASAREEPLVVATELCDRVGDERELLGLLFQRGQFYLERLRLTKRGS